jgi:hypothetical protein
MNQKELNELGDLINERRELEVKFKENVAKLDERIAAKVGKLQPEPVVKPVKVEEFTRNRPGRPKKPTAPVTLVGGGSLSAANESPAQLQSDPEGADPVGDALSAQVSKTMGDPRG